MGRKLSHFMKHLPLLTWWQLGRPLLSKCTQWTVMRWCQTCPPSQVQCEQWTDLWGQKWWMNDACYERKKDMVSDLVLQHLIAWRGSLATLIFILNPYFNYGITFFSKLVSYINSLHKSRILNVAQNSPGFCPINSSKQWHDHWGAMTSLHQMEPVVCLMEGIIIMYQVKPMVFHAHCYITCQHLWGFFNFPELQQETTYCRTRMFLNLKCWEFLDTVS